MNGSMLLLQKQFQKAEKHIIIKTVLSPLKDTKYTSTYETVVNDKVYKFSGWTESIKDKIITYTGSWTTTDIIDLSKAVVEVTPAQAAFTGGKHCSYCKSYL